MLGAGTGGDGTFLDALPHELDEGVVFFFRVHDFFEFVEGEGFAILDGFVDVVFGPGGDGVDPLVELVGVHAGDDHGSVFPLTGIDFYPGGEVYSFTLVEYLDLY